MKNNMQSTVSYKSQIPSTAIPTQKPLSIAIPVLQQRKYVPSKITIENAVSTGRYVISYTVDGLKEYALLAIPSGKQPEGGFPVVIIDHGYIIPSQYSTVSSYATEVEFFANRGYVVLKPDYRGNGTSDGAEDPLQRYSYPVDVVTLLASLGSITQANPSQVYIWGHSMGGEVTLEVLEILGTQKNFPAKVKAVALWAPVIDPGKWFGKDNLQNIPEARLTPFPYAKTFAILGEPSDNSPIWQSINPLNYLVSIASPIQMSHATTDSTVPYSWSQELESKLKAQHKVATLISYAGADHNMFPDTLQALQKDLNFFLSYK